MSTDDNERGARNSAGGGTGEPAGSGPVASERVTLDENARRQALRRSGAGSTEDPPAPRARSAGAPARGGSRAAAAATTGAGSAGRASGAEASTTVLPAGSGRGESGRPPEGTERRPERPGGPRPERGGGPARPPGRPVQRTPGRGRRARLVIQRVDPWSVFLFALVASICLGIVLLVAVAALYVVLANLGVLASLNNVFGEVLGGSGPDEVVEPVFTAGRVLGGTAVLAAVDVVLLTILATLGALLYNLCASLTGGLEVVLGERD